MARGDGMSGAGRACDRASSQGVCKRVERDQGQVQVAGRELMVCQVGDWHDLVSGDDQSGDDVSGDDVPGDRPVSDGPSGFEGGGDQR